MPCLACGHEIAPGQSLCDTCYTPAGAPAVRPEARTYALRSLGSATGIAVALTALFQLTAGLWPLVGRAMAGRALRADDPELLVRVALAELVVVLPLAVAGLAAIVLVIVWFYRARKNLDAFPGAGPTLSAGWAIGGWFVPFANFVIPCRVMANIARDSLWKHRTPALVGVWWTAWLVSWLGDWILGRIDLRAYAELPGELAGAADYQLYIDYYTDSLLRSLPGLIAGMVAAVALIILISRISQAQEARIARGGPAGPVMPGMSVTAPPVPRGDGGTIRA
jgi:hypothetical protein